MTTNNWKKITFNHAQSSRGVSVLRKDRDTLVYEGDGLTLSFEVEIGLDLGVYFSDKVKQVYTSLSDAQIIEIRQNLEEALTFMGICHEII